MTLVWVLSPDTSAGVDRGDSDVLVDPETVEYAGEVAGAEATPLFPDAGPTASCSMKHGMLAASAAIALAAATAALLGSANGVQSGGPASNGDDLLRVSCLSV